MKYRVLDEFSHNNEGWEVRKYNPQKRTVWIAGRDYFLQFPWVVFMRLWSNDKSYFSVAFAKEDDSIVYTPMLPNCASTIASDDRFPSPLICNCVCLGGRYDWNDWNDDGFRHYCQPSWKSFNDMIARFWTSNFDSFDFWYVNKDAIREAFGEINPIHKWQKSNLDQVLAVLQNPTGLDEFILATTSVISNRNAQL